MSQDLFAVVVAVLVFLSGIAGLVYQTWDPRNEEVNETRDLINRLTGLVATLSALVLGLLIASANGFYNSQKTGLETVSARVLALDGVLRRYGPDDQTGPRYAEGVDHRQLYPCLARRQRHAHDADGRASRRANG